MNRIYNIAPLNAMRVHHKTPCVESGKCENCQIHSSVCNSIGIINHGFKTPGRFHIIMIGEEVGFYSYFFCKKIVRIIRTILQI